MPISKRQQRMRKYRDRALDESRSPDERLKAMRKAFEHAGFTRVYCAIGRRLCNAFIADPQMGDDLRDRAGKMLRDIAIGEAEHLSQIRQAKVEPTELLDDEIERTLSGDNDPKPHGVAPPEQPQQSGDITVRAPSASVAPSKPTRKSNGFTKIEELYPYISGLQGFDFNDSTGLERAPAKSWFTKRFALLVGTGYVVCIESLYIDEYEFYGDKRPPSDGTFSVDLLTKGIISFGNWHVDMSKLGPQFCINNWQLLPIDAKAAAVAEPAQAVCCQSEHSPVPRSGLPQIDPYPAHRFNPDQSQPPSVGENQILPPLRVSCVICRAMAPGMTPPPHDCLKFQG